jgi:predicted DNA-binding transcriptional regulator AlpA
MGHVPAHQAFFFESSRPVVGRGGWRDGACGGCYIASSVAGADDGFRREVTVTQTREMVPTAGDRGWIASDARWLSIRQIAGDLGVSSSTAYKWSARGVPWFPRSIRLHNGDIRVRRDWYEQWLAALEQ